MEQLELELGLVPMQKWLHVWDEAARKKACREAQAKDRGVSPVGEEGKEVGIRLQPFAATRPTGSGKCRA